MGVETFKNSVLSLHPEMEELAFEFLLNASIEKEYDTKCHLVCAGEIQKNLIFVTEGLVRGYYLDEKGNEITVRFINKVGWATHYTALISNQISKYSFKALEKTHTIEIPFDVILAGYEKFLSWERFGRLIAEEVLKTQQKRIESFQFLEAEARYLNFISENPELFNRISLSHLSTYLGIQRQSLTRIRKKIADK